MGGLSAAAWLGCAGKRVLVVERHDRLGGYAHGFERGQYRFDVAVHMTSGCEPIAFGEGAMIHHLLTLIGVRDRCTFIPLDPFYTAVYPDVRFAAPVGVQPFIDAHARLFPADEAGLRELVRLCVRVNREVKALPSDATPEDVVQRIDRFPLLAEYGGLTLADVMDRFLEDDRLKALFASLWAYQGLPPSRLAFVRWTPMLISYLHSGVFYCEGGFQNLANAVGEGIELGGGVVLVETEVTRILVDEGKVAGVELDGTDEVRAPVVISNADARETFEHLVGAESLPDDLLADLRRMRPSLSAVLMYLATDLGFSELESGGHELFLFESWDHDETYESMLAGRPTHIAVTIPSLVDPTVAPRGEHVVTLMTLVPYGEYRKEDVQRLLLSQAERLLPGLSDHITFVVGASPTTLEKFTLNHVGAIYGWEPSPDQAATHRLRHVTPIEGLFLSGHWTQPGGGIMPVIVSGAQTAQLVLGLPDVGTLMTTLDAALLT